MDNIVILGLWGIASSLVTEVITWVNKKLSKTVLNGRGSFIVLFAIALIGAGIHTGFKFSSWSDFSLQLSAIFTASQIWFQMIAKGTGIEVK